MRRDHRRGLAIAILIVVVAVATAVAQPSGGDGKVTVALLPLDAEARLSLYGQPVAKEIERALAADGLDVATVGQGDPVPTRAVLVVDGTIEKKGKSIVLRLRVRDPARAAVVAEVSATAASLTKIDKAMADATGKLIPEVRKQLELIAKAAADAAAAKGSGSGKDGGSGSGRGGGSGSAVTAIEPPVAPGILLIASSRVPLDGRPDAMVAAIAPAFERLIMTARHRPVSTTTVVGDRKDAFVAAVRAAGAVVGVAVDVLALDLVPGKVPTARARARVRIVDAGGTAIFDRVIRTDTLVGRRGELAATMAGYAGVQLAEVVRTRVLKAVTR